MRNRPRKILNLVRAMARNAVSYSAPFVRFLRRERFRVCNYGKRFGWLNVTPSGRIRSCTKKMDEIPVRFTDLDPKKIRVLRQRFREAVRSCNVDCYSNCAYNGFYFFRNLPAAVLRYAAGHAHRAAATA